MAFNILGIELGSPGAGRGPLGLGGFVNLQALFQTAADSGLSFSDFVANQGIDMSVFDAGDMFDAAASLPKDTASRLFPDAGPQQTDAKGNSDRSAPPVDTPSANTTSTSPASNGTTNSAASPPGAAVADQVSTAKQAAESQFDNLMRSALGTLNSARPSDVLNNNNLINRVFSGEGVRAENVQNHGQTVASMATSTADAVRDPNGLTNARFDGGQRQGAASELQTASLSRAEGQAPTLTTQPALAQVRADGNPAASSATQTFTAAQSAQQAPAYAGQQPTQQVQILARASADSSALPQSARGGESGIAGLQTPAGTTVSNAPIDRNTAIQQQLQSQQVPMAAQGRPDAVVAQGTAAQLAGATAVLNPQAHTMAQQIGQGARPKPAGTENAAEMRNALLAPAGHTLAGFLQRDHRGREQALRQRRANWLLTLLPGARRNTTDDSANAASSQWVFWLLTVIAYSAIAAALLPMLRSGGRLIDTTGNPTSSAWFLVIGGIAAIGSWLIGRKFAKAD